MSKTETESPEAAKQRQLFDRIANSSDRSEKTSWNRKMDNMVKLLAKLRPLEELIIDLQAQKMPIFDEVHQLRETMVAECIHPQQFLSHHPDDADNVVTCRFCNRKIQAAQVVSQA